MINISVISGGGSGGGCGGDDGGSGDSEAAMVAAAQLQRSLFHDFWSVSFMMKFPTIKANVRAYMRTSAHACVNILVVEVVVASVAAQ